MVGLRTGLLLLFVSRVLALWGQDTLPRLAEVDSLIAQSRTLVEQRKFPDAMARVEEAMAILRGAEPMDSVRLARCWFNYGRALDRSGKAGEAETWYLEALRFQEGDPQGNAPDLANTLNNLALLATGSGRFAEAEPLHLRALAIRERELGTADPEYLWSLNNLGVHFRQCGRYTLSAQYHLRAMEGRRRHLGATHPDYFWSVNNLSLVNRLLRKYREAESLGEEAVTLSSSIWGDGHMYHAVAINNLANLHFKQGELSGDSLYYLRSLEGYARALSIFRQRLGAGHDYISTALNNLGKASRALGRHDEAGTFYGEARDLLDQSVGSGHPKFAQVLDNFGDLALARGQADEALRLFREARDIRRQTLGPDHPHYANSMNSLGLLWWQTGAPDSAATALLEAHRVKRDQVGYVSLYLSEEEQASYLEDYLLVRDQCYAFAQKFGASVPAWAGHALEFSLHYKGLVLNNAAQVRQMAAQNPEWAARMVRLGELRQLLLQEYLKPAAEQKGVQDLETRAGEVERELIQGAAKFSQLRRDISWQALRDRLKEEELIVEFVDYRWCDPSPSGLRRYAAIVLGAGDAWPRFIPLFEEGELLPLLADHKERKADYVNELYAWADRGMVKLGSEKKSLYDLIWAKLEESGLKGIKTVYYSPSGILHRLNLGAIAMDDEAILSDRYHLVALNSTRQLVIPSDIATPSKDALLVGGVHFEVDSIQATLEETPLLASRAAAEAWTESGTRGGSWSYLKWTEKEVERIASSMTATAGFEAVQITGADATEEAIKAIGTRGPSPRVLHLATHGFFFPDPEIAPSFRRGMGEAELVFKSSDNPMIRSGLILAGGNYAWQHGRPVSPDREDGILTAYEISQMNLSNTELVVLSACETGLGDIRGNEGVYGLQRAFKIAGAKYLIMSLWQVPDRETMEFMTAFYRNWLPSAAEALAGKEEQMTIPEAFRKTQREMRDRFYNSYSWAGFVLLE